MNGLRFRVLDAAVEAERAAWLRLWGGWPRREVMAHPDYVALFARPGDRAVCAVGEHGDDRAVLFPLVLRPLAEEPWTFGDPRCDAATPYGYGGAFVTSVRPPDARRFWEEYEQWCRRSAVVSTFLRLSLFADQLLELPPAWHAEPRQPNIIVPLRRGLDAIRAEYTQNLRRCLQRARNARLTFAVDPAGARLDAFHRVYTHTMERRNARPWYFFSREFFERLFGELGGQCVLCHVLAGDEVVSSDLVLCSEESVYYFLGGTEASAFHLSPNHLLKDEAIAWAISRGKKYFVLGGGNEPGDGVFRYKRSFSRTGEVEFRVAHAVHDWDAYGALVARREECERALGRAWSAPPGYYPEYRG